MRGGLMPANPFDDLPKRDPREVVFAHAESAISEAIGDLAVKHGLTYNEMIRILARKIDVWAQYAERAERGGKADVG